MYNILFPFSEHVCNMGYENIKKTVVKCHWWINNNIIIINLFCEAKNPGACSKRYTIIVMIKYELYKK